MSIPSEESVKKIIGHEFPGGQYTIGHWENFLLTECTGAEALPDGIAHPVALFHVPFLAIYYFGESLSPIIKTVFCFVAILATQCLAIFDRSANLFEGYPIR